MSTPPSSSSRPSAETILHTVLLRREETLPLTPAEVADYDARHPGESTPAIIPPPPSLARLQPDPVSAPSPDNVIAFRASPAAFAYAARSSSLITSASREKLDRLIQEMRAEPPVHD